MTNESVPQTAFRSATDTRVSAGTNRIGSSGRLWHDAVLAVVMLIAVAVFVSGCEAGGAPDDEAATATEEQVDTFTGSGQESTDEFAVDGQWEIRWETEGETFVVMLIDEDGERVDTIVDHEGSGGGSTYPGREGTFSLEIDADGDWSIRIFEHSD